MAPNRSKIDQFMKKTLTSYEGVLIVKNYDPKENPKGGKFQESSPFAIDIDTSRFMWTIKFYPGGFEKKSRYISIEFDLQYESLTQEDCERLESLEFRLCILDGENQERRKSISEMEGPSGWLFRQFVLRSEITDDESLLTNGSLRIRFSIDLRKVKSTSVPEATSTSRDRVCSRMEQMFLSQKYCDVKLVVNEQEFLAHRVVIASGSSLLDALLKKSGKEKEESDDDNETIEKEDSAVIDEEKSTNDVLAIRINGVQARAVENMIGYFYKGTIDDEAAKEVLAIAKMFQIVDLEELCEDLLSDQISLDNIYEIFQLSYDNNAERLKQNAKTFVHDNYATLCRHPEFRTLVEKIHPNARTSFFIAAPKPALAS